MPVAVPAPPARKRSSPLIPIAVIIVVLIAFFALAYEGVFVIEGITKPQSYEYGEGAYTYEWEYDGAEYSMSLDIPYDSYLSYSSQSIERGFTSDGYGNIDYDHVRDFMTEDDLTISTIAADLKQLAAKSDLDDFQTLELALAFVQHIPYSYDNVTYDQEDYWAYAVETLVRDTGDCEDTSFLFASIVENLGTDAAIIIYDDHIAVGISHPDATGTFYMPDEVKYYYCETTSVGWSIGELPEGRDTAYVVEV
jgi:hypothetical protein